ncbi:MAG: STAS domain-containing protein [bacterium]
MPEINKKYTGEGADKRVIIDIDENILALTQFNTLNDFVDNEVKDGIKFFTFDLSALKSINSSGLGILISGLKNVKKSGGSLKIINANEKILNIFKLTKLDNVFEFETST